MQEAVEAALAAGIQPHPVTGWKRAAFVNFVISQFSPEHGHNLLRNWNLPAILSNPETA
jgi:hypothetical protein